MRTLAGFVVGILVTIGAAWVHDTGASADTQSPQLSDRQIVNWDVLGAVFQKDTEALRGLWGRATHS